MIADNDTTQPIDFDAPTEKREPAVFTTWNAAARTARVLTDRAGSRLFVVEQSGQIRIVHNGLVLPEPFLDIADRLPALNPFFDERGLPRSRAVVRGYWKHGRGSDPEAD